MSQPDKSPEPFSQKDPRGVIRPSNEASPIPDFLQGLNLGGQGSPYRPSEPGQSDKSPEPLSQKDPRGVIRPSNEASPIPDFLQGLNLGGQGSPYRPSEPGTPFPRAGIFGSPLPPMLPREPLPPMLPREPSLSPTGAPQFNEGAAQSQERRETLLGQQHGPREQERVKPWSAPRPAPKPVPRSKLVSVIRPLSAAMEPSDFATVPPPTFGPPQPPPTAANWTEAFPKKLQLNSMDMLTLQWQLSVFPLKDREEVMDLTMKNLADPTASFTSFTGTRSMIPMMMVTLSNRMQPTSMSQLSKVFLFHDQATGALVVDYTLVDWRFDKLEEEEEEREGERVERTAEERRKLVDVYQANIIYAISRLIRKAQDMFRMMVFPTPLAPPGGFDLVLGLIKAASIVNKRENVTELNFTESHPQLLLKWDNIPLCREELPIAARIRGAFNDGNNTPKHFIKQEPGVAIYRTFTVIPSAAVGLPGYYLDDEEGSSVSQGISIRKAAFLFKVEYPALLPASDDAKGASKRQPVILLNGVAMPLINSTQGAVWLSAGTSIGVAFSPISNATTCIVRAMDLNDVLTNDNIPHYIQPHVAIVPPEMYAGRTPNQREDQRKGEGEATEGQEGNEGGAEDPHDDE